MFGLESQKKEKKDEAFVFELEKELKDPVKRKSIRQKVENRLQKIKEALRSGDNQEEFERLALLLNGYQSLLKVIERFVPKLK